MDRKNKYKGQNYVKFLFDGIIMPPPGSRIQVQQNRDRTIEIIYSRAGTQVIKQVNSYRSHFKNDNVIGKNKVRNKIREYMGPTVLFSTGFAGKGWLQRSLWNTFLK